MMETLNKKLIKIQKELKAPKGQYNSFSKFHYRSAEDILEALKPLLSENDLLMLIKDTIEQVGERYYLKAEITISDGENELSVTGYARECLDKKGMDDSQITGAASSYARKYALNGMFLIDDTKDADTDEYQKQTQSQSKTVQRQNKKQQVQDPEQITKLKDRLEKGIKASVELGADDTLVAMWRTMELNEAINDIVKFVNENRKAE